jgi:carbohydrate-selective porin OprB
MVHQKIIDVTKRKRKRRAHGTFMLICTLLLSASTSPSAFGQSPTPSDSSLPIVATSAGSAQAPAPAGFLTSSYLTGDWWGARSSLADNGVNFDIRYTSTYQGLLSGTGDEDFNYGGKVDAFINLDSGKMGLWNGGGLRSHIEYRHGDAPSNLGGTIFAVNTALYWPLDSSDKVVATSVYFTQKVGDPLSCSASLILLTFSRRTPSSVVGA